MSNPDSPNQNQAFARLQMAASRAATSPRNQLPDPSREQLDAGAYQKGYVVLHGLMIVIENDRNSVRSGVSEGGKAWANRMNACYGEFSGTTGADGDPVDVFIGHFPESRVVWIINQGWPDGGFDEHKVCMGHVTEQQARDAYLMSFDRNWTGLQSMHRCTVEQLKWWLKNGDMRIPFSPEQVPDGVTTMQKTLWTPDAEPVGTQLSKLMYDIRLDDSGAGLMLDAVSMAEIMGDPDIQSVPVFDALVVEVNRMTIKMNLLQKVMDAAGTTLTVPRYQISDPVKLRGTLQVAVLFELSDGQTITVWFHNPDTTPNKLMPMDELISWAWKLNKKDITVVVAPEHGKDLNVREVARRIMKLAERNSAAFAKANTKLAERLALEASVDAEIPVLTARLSSLQTQIEVAKMKQSDAARDAAKPKTQAEMDAYITSPEGYATIKGDESKLLEWQDVLDAFFQGRLIAIRNVLRNLGWDAPMYQPLFKNQSRLQVDSMRVGAGSNVVGLTFIVTEHGAAVGTPLVDDLTLTAQEIAVAIDANVLAEEAAPVVEPEVIAPVAEVVEAEAVIGKPVSSMSPEEFQAMLVAKKFEKTAVSEPVAVDMGGFSIGDKVEFIQPPTKNHKRGIRYTGEIKNGAGGDVVVELDDASPKFAGGVSLVPFRASSWTLITNSEVAPSPDDDLAAQVDAAYKFANATQAFKVEVAGSIEDEDYSSFASAKAMDEAAKAAGLSIAWSTGLAVLDGVEQAQAVLQIALETAENNAPINAAEGNADQAALEVQTAADIREALEVLGKAPVLDEADNQTDDKAHEQVAEEDKADDEKDDKGADVNTEREEKAKDETKAEDKPDGDDDSEAPGDDPDEEDFDPEHEFDSTPEEVETHELLDGDYIGHPFRGNASVAAGHESKSAVHSSMRAKGAEKRGDAKAAKNAHKAAHYAHKAALVTATGTTRKYHKTMADFHGKRGGASKVLDSAVLDAAEKSSVIIGKIKKGASIIGRAMIGGDGKAMVYVGKVGTERVMYTSGVDGERRKAMWSDDDAGEMIDWLVAGLAPVSEKMVPGGPPPRLQWERDVVDQISKQGEISNSDAQAIFEAQSDLLEGQWATEADAVAAAAAILASGAQPAAEETQPEPEATAVQEPITDLPVGQVSPAPDAAAGAQVVSGEMVALGAEPHQTDPAPLDPQRIEDTDYLNSLIDGTGDLMAEDTFAKMEPMFTRYEADAAMMDLLTRAAEVYGDAAVAAAQAALATPA